MHRTIAAAVALVLLALSSAPAAAIGVADQSQTNGSVVSLTWSLPAVAGSHMDLRQTFTVGRTGTLDTISVDGDDFGAAVTLTLVSPSGNVDKQTINMTGSHWTQVTLTTPPKVTKDEVMQLVLTPSHMINWYGTCDDLYGKGEALVFDPSARVVESIFAYGLSTGNATGYCTLDFAFQTYVKVASVPTPTPTPKHATPAASAAPAATASAVPSVAAGSAAPPSDTPAATDSAAPTTGSGLGGQPASPTGSTSDGGGGGASVAIIIVALVALVAAAGGAWWFLVGRHRSGGGGVAQ